jgi:hypothetical protein
MPLISSMYGHRCSSDSLSPVSVSRTSALLRSFGFGMRSTYPFFSRRSTSAVTAPGLIDSLSPNRPNVIGPAA